MAPHDPLFNVLPTHFRGHPKFGRTTTVIEIATGMQQEFMGDLPKGVAIQAFKQRRR